MARNRKVIAWANGQSLAIVQAKPTEMQIKEQPKRKRRERGQVYSLLGDDTLALVTKPKRKSKADISGATRKSVLKSAHKVQSAIYDKHGNIVGRKIEVVACDLAFGVTNYSRIASGHAAMRPLFTTPKQYVKQGRRK